MIEKCNGFGINISNKTNNFLIILESCAKQKLLVLIHIRLFIANVGMCSEGKSSVSLSSRELGIDVVTKDVSKDLDPQMHKQNYNVKIDSIKVVNQYTHHKYSTLPTNPSLLKRLMHDRKNYEYRSVRTKKEGQGRMRQSLGSQQCPATSASSHPVTRSLERQYCKGNSKPSFGQELSAIISSWGN